MYEIISGIDFLTIHMTGLTRETVNITLKDSELSDLVHVKQQTYEICREKVRDIIG